MSASRINYFFLTTYKLLGHATSLVGEKRRIEGRRVPVPLDTQRSTPILVRFEKEKAKNNGLFTLE